MAYAFAVLASESGWTHEDILKLTVRQFHLYLRQLDKIDARRNLTLCTISAFPHVDKSEKKKIIKRYQDIIAPSASSSQERIDNSWNLLRRMKKSYGRLKRRHTSSDPKT